MVPGLMTAPLMFFPAGKILHGVSIVKWAAQMSLCAHICVLTALLKRKWTSTIPILSSLETDYFDVEG